MLFRIQLGLLIAAILLVANIAFAAIYKEDQNLHSETDWKVICMDNNSSHSPWIITGLDAAYKLGVENCGRGNFSMIDHHGNDELL